MSECVFCEIMAGREAVTMVWRDDVVSVFLDTQPVNPGHLLVVPNAHATSLADLPAETAGHMFQVAQRQAAVLRASALRSDGVNLFMADGLAAMQEIFHVHLHVIPRIPGDGFGLTFGAHYHRKPPRRELDEHGEVLRRGLALLDATDRGEH